MKRLAVLGVVAILIGSSLVVRGQYTAPTAQFVDVPAKGKDVTAYNGLVQSLKGRIVDHTANHGKDNRIWSRAMHCWRDLYIYLPPGYSPDECYPFMLFLHPVVMDERAFLSFVQQIDEAIVYGRLPPMIVAAPDGSLDGTGSLSKPGSFFLNSGSGAYEDFVLQDVWDFVTSRYPIRPERCAHVLAGASMGGYAAFNYGLRHKNAFGTVIGIHPPLNMRWADVDGNPRAKFDPRRWGWRSGFDTPHEVAATYFGAFKIREANYLQPAFGVGDEALMNIACNNPLELLLSTCYRNGELSMFVGYAGRDEFNIDAQVDSFLYYCKFKGIGVAVAFEPDGRHDIHTAKKLFGPALTWLAPQIAPYAPPYRGPGLDPPYPQPHPPRQPTEDPRYPAPGAVAARLPRDPGVPRPATWPVPRAVNPAAPATYPSPGGSGVLPSAPLRWPGVGY